jgi:hypothetical protein
MEFKDLTKRDIQYLKKCYTDSSIKWEDKLTMMSEHIGKSNRKHKTINKRKCKKVNERII